MSSNVYLTVYVLLIALSIVTNSLLLAGLFLLRREPSPASTNIFILSLALSNTVIGVLLAESAIADSVAPRTVNTYRCYVVPFLRLFSVSSSVFSMVAIVLDLYRAVRRIDAAQTRRSWGAAGLIAVWAASGIYSGRMVLQMVLGSDHHEAAVPFSTSRHPVLISSLPDLNDLGSSSFPVSTILPSYLFPVESDVSFTLHPSSFDFVSSSLPGLTGSGFVEATSAGEGSTRVSDDRSSSGNSTTYVIGILEADATRFDLEVTTFDVTRDATPYDFDLTLDVEMTSHDDRLTSREEYNDDTYVVEYLTSSYVTYGTEGSTLFPPRPECSTHHPTHRTFCNLVIDDGLSDIIFIVVDLLLLFLLPVLIQFSLYYVIVRSLWRSSVALGNGVVIGNENPVVNGNGVVLGNRVVIGNGIVPGNPVALGNGVALGNRVTTTRHHRRLVRMSLTVLSMFVLCWAPWHAIRLAIPSLRATGWHGDEVTARQVATILACCNSWITPLAYSVFNTRLRAQLGRMFRCATGTTGVVVPVDRNTVGSVVQSVPPASSFRQER